MSTWLSKKILLILSICVLIVGCGFQLRGFVPIAFKSVRVLGNLQITEPLKAIIVQQGATVVIDSQQPAELDLDLIQEESEKSILSLSGQGVVREYGLLYRVKYRSRIQGEPTWSEPLIMESRRNYTYNDADLLGKQAEEKRINQDMQLEVMQGIMRRISALKKDGSNQ